jgi:hypothetical protein
MKEQFEYGEWVEVRDFDDEEWLKRYYIDTLEFGDTGLKWYCTHDSDESPNNHKGYFQKWAFIRKIQKPEPEPEPLFISTQGVFTAEEAVMQLQERIEKILEELNALKTQLK